MFARRKDTDDAPAASDGDELVDTGEPQSEDEAGDAEKKFGELMEMFSSTASKQKATKRARAPATITRRSQRVEEIGPSGQTYTPFELQVRVLSHDCRQRCMNVCRCES